MRIENLTGKDLLSRFSLQNVIRMINWLIDDHDMQAASALISYLASEYICDDNGDIRNARQYGKYREVKAQLQYKGQVELTHLLSPQAKSKINQCQVAVWRCFDD